MEEAPPLKLEGYSSLGGERRVPSSAASLRFQDCRTGLLSAKMGIFQAGENHRIFQSTGWSQVCCPDSQSTASYGAVLSPRTAPLALPSALGLALAPPTGAKIPDFIHNLYQMLKLDPWDPEPAVMLHYP